MNSTLPARAFLACSLAFALVCGGAWYALLRGPRQERASARLELASQRRVLDEHAKKASVDAGAYERTSARLAQLTSIAEATPRLATLYQDLHALAVEQGVSVIRLDPSKVGTAGNAALKDTGLVVRSMTCSLDVQGPFASATAFVDQLESAFGLARLTSLRLTPLPGDDGKGNVIATIESIHFEIDQAPFTPPASPSAHSAKGNVP